MVSASRGRIALALALTLCISFAASSGACSDSSGGAGGATSPAVSPAPYGMPYDKLSDWHLFVDATKQAPSDGVVPYDVISPLFSDYATKFRFIYVPKGQQVTITDDTAWDMPVGTILVKTFSYLADTRDPTSKLTLVETRILYREPDGWAPSTYQWDADGKDATRMVAGPTVPVTFIDPSGNMVSDPYAIPSKEQCKFCHSTGNDSMGKGGSVTPIGIKTRELNRDFDYGGSIGAANQIDHFASLGWFASDPPAMGDRVTLSPPCTEVDPASCTGDVALRARSYWDGNCAHCHSKGGYASASALLLDFGSTDPAKNPDANWGVCKIPTSAPATCGDTYDIVPGDPDHSIMNCRMSTTDPMTHMPLLGGNLIHAEGLALVRAFISSLPPNDCSTP